MPDVLLIISQEDFQPIEYLHTKQELENAGFSVDVASITTNVAVGKDGSEVKPNLAVKDANADYYKAVVLIGGPGALELGKHKEVLELLKQADKKEKIIAAICISPVILAKAGLLKGKKATVWNGDRRQSKILESAGAEFIDRPVVVDGRTITANGPAAAKEFGRTISNALE